MTLKNNDKTIFTTLPEGSVWECVGILLSRPFQEKLSLSKKERDMGKQSVPHIETDRIPDWLCNYANYAKRGKKPILLNRYVSENTHYERVLFSAILAKHTIHKTGTDSDINRPFLEEDDIDLLTMWKDVGHNCPVFIRLWDQFPEIYEELKKHDGKEIRLSLENSILTISLPETKQEFTINVKSIKTPQKTTV